MAKVYINGKCADYVVTQDIKEYGLTKGSYVVRLTDRPNDGKSGHSIEFMHHGEPRMGYVTPDEIRLA